MDFLESPPEVYIFGLIDEDAKSIQPGNFERHWGIFNYDGTLKYSMNLGNGRNLVPAKGVKYLAKEWCVMSPEASTSDPNLGDSVNYACTYADCTSLGFGSSCGELDAKSNASYAFNRFYQTANQQKGSCGFNNLAVLTTKDPSHGTCRFEIMIDVGKHDKPAKSPSSSRSASSSLPRPYQDLWSTQVFPLMDEPSARCLSRRF
ncbi:Glycoside hydrolase [Macleaya cordata]|uniref:Glycoside hydrolase n=1 Tax=Macleaya cordata TaxID=56857 RepID=A0A200R006_MACCD|nr:Glycoside hydrolase [Macleaya cordata]